MKHLFFLMLLASPLFCEAASEDLAKWVERQGFKSSEIGIWAGTSNAKEMKVLWALNEKKLFTPASLSKLVTAAAVLRLLPAGYKYKTELLSANPIQDGVLKGPLFFRGGGNPSFVSEEMWVLVNNLRRSGLTKIEGDIVVDDTRFDALYIDEDRESVRVDRAYDAPVGGLSFNWNSVNVYVRPGAKAGEPCQVWADPENAYVQVENNTRTAGGGAAKTIAVHKRFDEKRGIDVVRVEGQLPLGHDEVTMYKNISQPAIWAGSNLVEFLRQRGIVVQGQVRKGTTPERSSLLASVDSKALALIVADMAKFSNNYVAEMLVKNLAAEAGEKPATMKRGMQELHSFLEKMGLKKSEYTFVNAAGFSRENKMTPEQLGRLMELSREDFQMFPEFSSSLPIAGIDGTLKNRMKKSAAERWVRAKTGLLNGVVGLAGFAGQKNGHIITFAFMYNGSGKEDRARGLFDRMAARLVQDDL